MFFNVSRNNLFSIGNMPVKSHCAIINDLKVTVERKHTPLQSRNNPLIFMESGKCWLFYDIEHILSP